MIQIVNAPRRSDTPFGTACGGRATPTTACGLLCRLGAVVLVLAVCALAVAADESRPPPGAPISTEAATPSSLGASAPDGAALSRATLLPKDLSVWGMFLSADRVVKGVMIGLVLASIATWTVALAKSLEIAGERTRLRKALDGLVDATDLAEAAARAAPSRAAGALVAAAASEIELSSDLSDRAGIKERVASHLERIESNAGRAMARGTGILATVGAIAPFVGLFGTVWGIMNSFIGISQQQTTNLAVVAPGIAEALLATALGLVAAVPAVVIYNACSRAIAAYRALQADAAAAVLRLVSRDLDRAAEARADAGRGRLLERARKA